MIPACDHTGTPRHFHTSTTSGSASLISARTRASVLPRQSPNSSIRASISREGDSPWGVPLLTIWLRRPSAKHVGWVSTVQPTTRQIDGFRRAQPIQRTTSDTSGRLQLRHRGFGRVAQHVAAAPDRLDIVFAAGCLGELLAQLADEDVDDLQLRLVHPAVKMVQE